MILSKSIKTAQAAALKAKKQNKRIGFVPTMGALHQGHFSLIRRARKENDFVAVSIFVNPIQFSPSEDLKKYPRTFKTDYSACKKLGVDLIFYPSVLEMYPKGFKTFVQVNGLSDCLCGKARPGHFKGVTTVVSKLLNIIRPDCLYLGQKDAQQAVIIKKMIEDLNMPVRVMVMPTVREKNGLALSSRNKYLNEKERADALVLWHSLKKARAMIKLRKLNSADIIKEMKKIINCKNCAKIDYIQVVDLENLSPIKRIVPNSMIALAVRIGKTRLIDNSIVK